MVDKLFVCDGMVYIVKDVIMAGRCGCFKCKCVNLFNNEDELFDLEWTQEKVNSYKDDLKILLSKVNIV